MKDLKKYLYRRVYILLIYIEKETISHDSTLKISKIKNKHLKHKGCYVFSEILICPNPIQCIYDIIFNRGNTYILAINLSIFISSNRVNKR